LLYFDHNSTTPVDFRVADVLDRAHREVFGNASSIHIAGQTAKQMLEKSRRGIASALGAKESEIVFTSGGTESNNLAIHGVLSVGMHAVTTVIEHPAVLEPLRPFHVTRVPVAADGVVSVEAIAAAIRPETALVSVMLANNETGVIQPVAQIAQMLRGRGILLHSDGVQAVGKIPVNLTELGVDLFSISGHKLYAPKGIAALYVRKGVNLKSRQWGGRHERGLRAGTENVAGAMALHAALDLCSADEQARLAQLRDEFERRILHELPHAIVNAAYAPRLPNTSNICFPGVSGEALLIALDMAGMCVSTGSACSSGSVEPSHVLLEMGLTPKQARSCIRFSFGRGNSLSDVDQLATAVSGIVSRMNAGAREHQLV
jgi:cysteine desulfurase